MSNLKDPNSKLSIAINTATDIYVLKKEDLIKYCEAKKLNSKGKSVDLRARLSRYIKGILHPDDIKDTLSHEERTEVLNKSKFEKIDLDQLEKETGLAVLNTESIQGDKLINKEINKTITDNLNIFDNLNNSVNSFSNKINDILDSTETTHTEFFEEQNNPLINFDTTNFNNTTVPHNKIESKMNYEKKYMVIKPDNFSGEGDIKSFFKQYERAAEVNNWEDKEKIKFLPIFLKDTANTFFENLENTRETWTWENLKKEFINEFQPIGYSILLKNKLENRRQDNSESITSYVTDIENLCRQVDKNMDEENICIYILKGLKEQVLNAISLHDNSNLKKIKNNLKQFELMQFRINSRGQNLNEYTKILNEQVFELNKKTSEKGKEIEDLKRELQERDREYKRDINKLSEDMKQINLLGKIRNRSVNFENDRRDQNNDRYEEIDRNYKREVDYRRDYRDKSPYPRDYNDRSRRPSRDRQYGKDRSLSRDTQFYSRRSRETSPYKNNNKDYRDRSYSRDRDNKRSDNYNNYNTKNYRNRSYSSERYNKGNDTYTSRHQYSRDNSRDRTPDRRGGYSYENKANNITCYKCNEEGHYADKCRLSKND